MAENSANGTENRSKIPLCFVKNWPTAPRSSSCFRSARVFGSRPLLRSSAFFSRHPAAAEVPDPFVFFSVYAVFFGLEAAGFRVPAAFFFVSFELSLVFAILLRWKSPEKAQITPAGIRSGGVIRNIENRQKGIPFVCLVNTFFLRETLF